MNARLILVGLVCGTVIIAMLLLLTGVYTIVSGPRSFMAHAAVANVKDQQKAGTIIDEGIAQPIGCGTAARNAYDPMTKESRFFFYQWPNGNYECFQSAGYHRITGIALEPLTVKQGKVIIGDPKKYPADTDLWAPPARVAPVSEATPAPGPTQTPAPVPVVDVTPVPELGVPCCPTQ